MSWAVTNGRSEVNFSDVFLLKDCLWNHPDNALKVREMIKAVLQGFSYEVQSEANYIVAPDCTVIVVSEDISGTIKHTSSVWSELIQSVQHKTEKQNAPYDLLTQQIRATLTNLITFFKRRSESCSRLSSLKVSRCFCQIC